MYTHPRNRLEEKMSPTDDNAFLHHLEAGVREEITVAETSHQDGEPAAVPADDWMLHPDAQRYDVALHALLGAVEAVEGSSRGASPPHGSHPAAGDHCLSLARAVDRPAGAARYGRMFPGVDPLGTAPRLLVRAGDNGGICDAAAVLDQLNADGGDDAEGAAGWPFFGQLIAHDITADRSPIGGGTAPAALRNARAPKLNLETLYGDGPVGSPYLFDLADPATFLLSPDGRDVPRNRQGVALIGDPRNDQHMFALTLHVALLRAHNRIASLLRETGVAEGDVFDQARLALTWHYQWIVVHDFLPRIVGASLVKEVLTDGGRWFAPPPGQAFIPLEFADAAFRYGHSQIRHAYRLTEDGPAVPLFPDLIGFRPLPPGQRLDLAKVFDIPGHPAAQRAKRIDGRLAASLIQLPHRVTGTVEGPAYHSLAVRDLLRGQTTGLPSGEAVAKLIGAAPLTADEVEHAWPGGTPLWFYILKEAQHRGGGDRLGPVGGRIVAEVLIGLLRSDPASYLSLEPDWEPTLPAAGPDYGLADLITLGVHRDRPARPA
jgi:Animal haem peroxidase